MKRRLLLSTSPAGVRSVVCLAFLCATTAWSAVSTLVPLDATWRYLDNGSNQGTNWIGRNFPESGWLSGRAELGYGDGDEATVVGFGSNQNNKFVTTYFRHSFAVTNVAAYSNLTLKLVRDDGVVVYLNGQEVIRNNLPSGAIASSTLALSDIDGAAEFSFVTTNLPASMLANGTNVLAAAIHQFARNSSDISFAAELSATLHANIPPVVTLVSPTNGASFVAPTDITLIAAASDTDGSVARVEFYEGDTLIGEDAVEPYSLTWSNATPGNYQFTVVAVDDGEGRSSPGVVDVLVRENTAPVVAITAPTNTSRFIAPVDITVRVSASDGETRVDRVELFEGTNLLGVLSNAPYVLVWSNVAIGTYSLSAVATDDSGLSGTSAPVVVSVNPNMPPVVSLLFPTNGTSLAAPADILLRAAASDVDGFVPVVEFYAGTNKLGQSTDSPFFLSWTNILPGMYDVFAVGTDNKGGRGTSTVSTVTIRLPQVTRGPYLQNGTSNSITVRWRTDSRTDTRVKYGLEPSLLDGVAHDATRTSEHEIRLTGLAPNTRYYYSIGFDGMNLAGGTDHFFVTSPTDQKPTRIWVLGDSGTATDDARRVRDAYYTLAGTNHTDLWLMLGDNAYWTGLDPEYQDAVFNMYPDMLRKSVLWPAIGNHDAYALDVTGEFPYLNIFTLPTAGEAGGVASGTEQYYSFDYGNIHFICLDSMTVDRSSNGPMCGWLREDLAANTNLWTIAFFHHPPYTKGSHDSDWEFELVEMREHVLPILEAHGVDLVLAGHSHSYERSYRIGGHYGTSDTLVPEMIRDTGDGRWGGSGAYVKRLDEPADAQSAIYVVAGSSGQISGGELNHPAMFVSLNELGSMILDINGNRLDAKFLQDNGTIGDSFTLLKGTFTNTLEVLSFTMEANSKRFTWKSNPGDSYVIERSETLLSPAWEAISPILRANTSLTTWTSSTLQPNSSGFYRVRRLSRQSLR